jgi:hypothetical protein
MRISDDRYSRDRQRLDIAMHFIHHEARTHTIRQWTGLTDDRIRKLYRSYLQDGGRRVARHRGKSPQQAAFFLRTARIRHEAGALAGLCCLVGAIDQRPGGSGALPLTGVAPPAGVARAAALCQAYDVYRAIVSAPGIGFEHAVLLVNALARGNELALGNCHVCGALLVVDALALRPARCAVCAEADPRRLAACSAGRRPRPGP